jgi:hypothetical protein
MLLVLVAQTASAEVVEPPPEPGGGAEPKLLPTQANPAPAAPATGYSHKGQILVSLRAALGLRAIVSYDKGDYCGATDNATSSGNAPVCTGRAPFAFDLELGYGVAQRIDAFVEVRLGLEPDFAASPGQKDGPRMLHVSPGARFFFSDSKTSKLFTTAQLVFDFAGYKDLGGASRGKDFGVRNMNGLWLDLDRAKGFYAYVGETATFSRWIRFELEIGLGFSARFR